MPAASAIEIAELTVVRGAREVVRGVSVTVAAGAVTGLLGPSGCGKTTLCAPLSVSSCSQADGSPCSGLPPAPPRCAVASATSRKHLPSYAYDALARVTRSSPLGGDLAADAAVIVLATVGALALGAITLRRRTAQRATRPCSSA